MRTRPDNSLLRTRRRARAGAGASLGSGALLSPGLASRSPRRSSRSCSEGTRACSFSTPNAATEQGLGLVRRLKGDAFTAIVPVVALAGEHRSDVVREWFSAGTDEVLTGFFSPEEQRARIEAMRARTERDVSVHPSTRLPGTTEIERDVRRRLETSEEFAVCYADLDHFKEYNDRYSYYDGDRVIYLLSRLLHDVVKGLLGAARFRGAHWG